MQTVVITSMGRADRIRDYTLKLFPEAIICVPENEGPMYQAVAPNNRIITHPTGLNSHVAAIQYVLDHVPDEVVWSVDDDLIDVVSNTGRAPRRYNHPDDIDQILENCVEMARGCGAHLCGFAMSGDPKAYVSMDPIRLCATINGACWGFIGRDLRFDNASGVNGDVDMVLQHLRTHRVVFVDQRFHVRGVPRNSNPGGGAIWRSDEEYERGMKYLKKKWGQYITFGYRVKDDGSPAHARTTALSVRRRQSVTQFGGEALAAS